MVNEALYPEMLKAIRLLNKHNFSVCSTDRQLKGMTIMVMDDITGEYYTIHSNGYARRRIRGYYNTVDHYQINPVRRSNPYKRTFYGETYYHYETERILFPGDYVKLAELVIITANRQRNKIKD